MLSRAEGTGGPTSARALVIALPVLVALGYVALQWPRLGLLWPDPDEGVYIQVASAVEHGAVPYRDVYVHQTPLYLYVLAGLMKAGAAGVRAMRAPSLLAVAVTSVAIFTLLRPVTPLPGAIAGQIAFLFSTIPYHVLGAIPNALAVALATLGAVVLLRTRSAAGAWVAAAVTVVALATKPTVLVMPVALVAALALSGQTRRRVLQYVGAGALLGAAALSAFDLLSAGGFGEVLRLQIDLQAGQDKLAILRGGSIFGELLGQLGITSVRFWNLFMITRVFLTGGLDRIDTSTGGNTSLWLAVGALAGALIAGYGVLRGRTPVAIAAVLLWFLCEAFADIYVWAPFWQNYALQIAVPMAVLTGHAVGALWHRFLRPRRAWGAPALASALAVYAWAGVVIAPVRPSFYAAAAALHGTAPAMLSFNGLVNYISGIPPACDLIDPMNCFGRLGGQTFGPYPALRDKFWISTDSIVTCLHRQPETRVLVDLGFALFAEADAEFVAQLRALPADRFVFLSDAERRLWESGRSLGKAWISGELRLSNAARPDSPRSAPDVAPFARCAPGASGVDGGRPRAG